MPGLSLSMATLMQMGPAVLSGGYRIHAGTLIGAATVISA
jgi:hypothetical protein